VLLWVHEHTVWGLVIFALLYIWFSVFFLPPGECGTAVRRGGSHGVALQCGVALPWCGGAVSVAAAHAGVIV
jgi:hypothetical protein